MSYAMLNITKKNGQIGIPLFMKVALMYRIKETGTMPSPIWNCTI